ncbi:MAG TPA: EAL domain-containing protein [Thermoanaerobaculia bacterium]|jgi:diguanylate cyclase (GGDEF)-like protein/PAS domain S-box-containing protein
MIFANLSIRTKIALLMTVLLAIVSVAVYLFFPARLHQQIVDSVVQKSAALTRMAAFSVADGLQERNQPAVAAALTGIRSNPDLVYFLLLDAAGQPFASFNERIAREAGFQQIAMRTIDAPHVLQAGSNARPSAPGVIGGTSTDGSVYQTSAPVLHHGRTIGRLYTGMSLQSAHADAARSRATVALVTLLAFLLGTLAVFALSTVITGPLQRIVETTDGIAGGDYSKRAAVQSDDEVGQLARSFNRMVDEVTGAYGQLEELNRTLETRVADRTRELAVSEERYRLLFERNLAGAYVAREDGTVIDCNNACANLFGYDSREDFLAASGKIDYLHPHQRDTVVRRLREEGAVANEEVELRGRDGEAVWALENVRRIPPAEGEPAILEGILLDIGDRKRLELEVEFKAYHDALTQLPNRTLFLDRLHVALGQARRDQTCLAVLFLDLDNMKAINDTFGHATGDHVLQAVAKRLTDSVRDGDTVARVGGDEFLVLLTLSQRVEAEAIARQILARLAEPLEVDRDDLHLTTSIGVALFPEDGEDAETLIRHADGAMYRVKEVGGHDLQMSSSTARRTVGRLSLEEELRTAIDRDELVLHYQPQVHIESRKLSGAEALIRWQRPDGTLVSPAGFMTVAEQSGLITAIGEVVLTKACQQMVDWQRVGTAPLRMGVNVSARQFYQRDFIEMVERVLTVTGMAPMRLEIEITETVAMQTSERALQMLRHLRAMGIAVAVDDFGTGQSSLSYLKRFPVDTVKVDRSFVHDLISGENDEWIITAVLMLANHLGLRTVAEGVETEQQCSFLQGHDCREIQGYLVSKPLPPDVFAERFLEKRSRRVSESQSLRVAE